MYSSIGTVVSPIPLFEPLLSLPPAVKRAFARDLRLATKQSSQLGAGGDLFEVFDHGDGRISAMLADVCGHGAAAAPLATRLSPILHCALARDESPGRALVILNDGLCSDGLLDRFVTAVAVRIDVLTGLVEIACAGHMGPFLRSAGGRVQALNRATGVPLGLLARERYTEISLVLEPDDVLVLVTDGITDPLSTVVDPLGEAGLLRRLKSARHTTPAICQALLVDGTHPRDD